MELVVGIVPLVDWVPDRAGLAGVRLLPNQMRPRIDQFFHDSVYGVVKFAGYKEGKLIFHPFERSHFTNGPYSGWLPTGQRVNLDPEFQAKRFKEGRTRPILPPE